MVLFWRRERKIDVLYNEPAVFRKALIFSIANKIKTANKKVAMVTTITMTSLKRFVNVKLTCC